MSHTHERQIIFNAPAMAGLVAGRITQTRRVMWLPTEARDAATAHLWASGAGTPYYPGDRFWVAEPWAAVPERRAARADRCGPGGIGVVWLENCPMEDAAAYQWRSARSMPRWASRIAIQIEVVRVQRIRDISASDAMAEGVMRVDDGDSPRYTAPGQSGSFDNPIQAYRQYWDSLYHKRGAGWTSNHGVWALTFSSLEHGAESHGN